MDTVMNRLLPLSRRLHRRALDLADVLARRAAQHAKPELREPLERYPEWKCLPMLEARKVMHEVRTRARELGVYDSGYVVPARVVESGDFPTERLVPYALQTKDVHVYGVVGTFGQGGWTEYKRHARLLTFIELLLVDFPDTFGDLGGLRSYEDSQALYATAKAALDGQTIAPQSYSRHQPLSPLLYWLHLQTQAEVHALLARLRPDTAEALRGVVRGLASGYAECVAIMHEPDIERRARLAVSYLTAAAKERTVAPGLDHPELWYNAQGTHLGILGLFTEALIAPELTVPDVHALTAFYDQIVPFAHVYFDDTADREVDRSLNDFNLFNETLSGRYNAQLAAMAETCGLDRSYADFETNESSRVLALAHMLARLFARKRDALRQHPGALHTAVHEAVITDMARFYQWQLEREGNSNGLEARVVAEFLRGLAR